LKESFSISRSRQRRKSEDQEAATGGDSESSAQTLPRGANPRCGFAGVEALDGIRPERYVLNWPGSASGKWYKRFKSGPLAGKGELPSTFLAPGMAVDGEEVE
jgi:hypothetical protein